MYEFGTKITLWYLIFFITSKLLRFTIFLFLLFVLCLLSVSIGPVALRSLWQLATYDINYYHCMKYLKNVIMRARTRIYNFHNYREFILIQQHYSLILKLFFFLQLSRTFNGKHFIRKPTIYCTLRVDNSRE